MGSWKFLKSGDLVDVVATGYPSSAEEVQGALRFLAKWGLRYELPPGLIEPHFLHANEDEKRFHFLRNAIENPDSHTIWCLRGGYGSNRLLPYLAKLKKPKKPKLLIGISDITSLHIFLNQEWGWKTLHGPLLDRLGRQLIEPKYEKELQKLLFGVTPTIEFKKLRPLNEAAKKTSVIESKVVGGNLAVLQSGLATPWQIDTRKKLLFLEDIGERGYKVDRMLEQFEQAGLFKSCHGVLLGDFIGSHEPQGNTSTLPQVFERWALRMKIPVYAGVQAGHASIQRPLPLNTHCTLTRAGRTANLVVESGGKSS